MAAILKYGGHIEHSWYLSILLFQEYWPWEYKISHYCDQIHNNYGKFHTFVTKYTTIMINYPTLAAILKCGSHIENMYMMLRLTPYVSRSNKGIFMNTVTSYYWLNRKFGSTRIVIGRHLEIGRYIENARCLPIIFF